MLSCTQDAFFAQHRHSNYGDLGGAIKVLLEDYQRQAKMNETISSVEDMQVCNPVGKGSGFRSMLFATRLTSWDVQMKI